MQHDYTTQHDDGDEGRENWSGETTTMRGWLGETQMTLIPSVPYIDFVSLPPHYIGSCA
jgi:hypothetical protein